MTKVVATSKGYYGGIVREQGDKFDIPDDVMENKKLAPKWVRRLPFGGKGDHDGNGEPGGSKPKLPLAVTVPDDWQAKKPAERKALAEAISGEKQPNVKAADAVIVAYLATVVPEAAEPFGDAPAPMTVAEGVKSVGGIKPDWQAPGQ